MPHHERRDDFMKLLKPKRRETIKEEYDVIKQTKIILDLYSKYTNYDEGEILDHLVVQILQEDDEFIEWISKQRTIKKFLQANLLELLTPEQQQLFNSSNEVLLDEQDAEVCN